MKKLLLLIGLTLFLSACGNEETTEGELEEAPVEPIKEETEEPEQVVEEEPEEEQIAEEVTAEADETSWDDLKNLDNIVGKSDKDFSELTGSNPSDVRNDKTGNWRKLTLADNVDIEEYALSYSNLHMGEDEVHHIINFTRNTTTWLNELGGLLYVDIKERVDGEEHDASTLGQGMLLKSYIIYPDGDIQELDI